MGSNEEERGGLGRLREGRLGRLNMISVEGLNQIKTLLTFIYPFPPKTIKIKRKTYVSNEGAQ
jgi:hypothetical protein